MVQKFSVVLVPQPEGGFFIECPSLPGCYSQGETEAEALENIREAILLVLEDLEELGEPIPDTGTPVLSEVCVTR